MSRYRKIEVRTWGDEKFRSLSPIPPCGQGLWFYLLTGPHTGPIPGLFRAGRAALAEELGWGLKDFDKAFAELSSKKMASADFAARLVWIPNAVKHNRPESPNVIKGWGTEFDLLPESPLKYEALSFMERFVGDMPEGFRKAFQEVFRHARAKASISSFVKPSTKTASQSSAESMPNQEQEQDLRPTREEQFSGKGSTSQNRAIPGAANGQAYGWDDSDDVGGPA